MNLERLQKIAERTFLDLVDAFADTGNVSISSIPYDELALWQTSLSVEESQDAKWFLKSYEEKPKEIYDRELKDTCYKINLGTKEYKALRRICDKNGNIYFALSIRKKEAKYFISEFAPPERFHWFVLDLKDYFSQKRRCRLKRSICIPKKENLNSTFSLLLKA